MDEDTSFRTSFVLGFHACDASIAKIIMSGEGRHLRPSENKFDWLGSGIYFWESSPDRAVQYARESMRRPSPGQGKIRRPEVIGAIIDLNHCLDLLDSQFFPVVSDAFQMFKETVRRQNLPMPANRPLHGSPELLMRDLDCAVINFVHEYRRREKLRKFDSVRAAFIEGKPLYDGASFFDKNHIQICVRDPRCIKGYFRPLG